MAYNLRLADLVSMTSSEREIVFAEMEAAAIAPRNGQAAVLNARIRDLESQHGISSDEMRARLGRGEIPETEEVARWLYLLDARDNRVR